MSSLTYSSFDHGLMSSNCQFSSILVFRHTLMQTRERVWENSNVCVFATGYFNIKQSFSFFFFFFFFLIFHIYTYRYKVKDGVITVLRRHVQKTYSLPMYQLQEPTF